MNFVLLIPAFNEAETIQTVVQSCLVYGDVLVVDDGSTDGTSQLALKEGAKVLKNEHNVGYARTLMNGVEHLKDQYDFIIIIDADGEINPHIYDKILNDFKSDTFYIGNRLTKNRKIESLISFISKYFTKIDDIFCGTYIIPTNLLQKIGNQQIIADEALVGLKLALSLLSNQTLNIPFTPGKRAGVSRFGEGWLNDLKLLNALIKGFKFALNIKKNN